MYLSNALYLVSDGRGQLRSLPLHRVVMLLLVAYQGGNIRAAGKFSVLDDVVRSVPLHATKAADDHDFFVCACFADEARGRRDDEVAAVKAADVCSVAGGLLSLEYV